MSNSSLDRAFDGIQKAFERRAKERAKQPPKQHTTGVSTVTKVSSIKTTNKISDEQYRLNIISKMINLIQKRKIAQ